MFHVPIDSCKMQNECANVSIAPPNCLDANVPARVDKCYRYNNKDPQRMCQPYYTHDIVDADLLEKCDSWIYDTSTFTSTLVTEVFVASTCNCNFIPCLSFMGVAAKK